MKAIKELVVKENKIIRTSSIENKFLNVKHLNTPSINKRLKNKHNIILVK